MDRVRHPLQEHAGCQRDAAGHGLQVVLLQFQPLAGSFVSLGKLGEMPHRGGRWLWWAVRVMVGVPKRGRIGGWGVDWSSCWPAPAARWMCG